MHTFWISLSFDDGWKSAITHAFPVLQKYNLPATFYVISDRVDPVQNEYMDRADLRVLVSAGHEVGSHTRSHRHLPELSDEEVWSEIEQGVADLRRLGFSPRTFAYPYGDWSPRIVKQVREAGFFGARTIERGINDSTTNHLLLRAYAVREEDDVDDVCGWIREARALGGWLILYMHQVEPAAVLRKREWIYGTTPDVLEGILSIVVAERIQVLTVEQGLERLTRVA